MGRAAVRLLTLVGPGGIGKTRLAVAVAENLRSEFTDGVFYVSLAPLADASLVLPTIAESLGVQRVGAEGGQSSLLEHLQETIGRRKLLLVLDNFEQVVAASVGVAALLGACPDLKVLATSREVLHIAAEHCYPVPPLALPHLDRLPPLEFLAQVAAVRLFVTRAQAVNPDFTLTPGNAHAVSAICHRLDGLPLAIELAAARVNLLRPEAMLPRLERRLPWLTGGPRDAPERHQALRATVGWSYDLLPPGEQQLFRRIAVFVGGCTLDSVAAVCGSGSDAAPVEEDLLQAVTSLLDKSLLRQEPTGVEQSRLYMLETIREYALEQLGNGTEEAEATRRAHALYYMAVAERAEPDLNGPNQPKWLARLEEEHDNLRAALAWSTGGGDAEVGARLAAALWRFWLTRGHLSEGQRWLSAALSAGKDLPAVLRARTLNGAGRLAVRQGDHAAAQAMLEESLALSRPLADPKGEIQARHSLGLVAIYQGDFPRAQTYFEQNLEKWRALGDRQGIAQTLNNLGLALRYQHDYEQAALVYEECLALCRELQDQYGVGAALHNLGQMAHHMGDDARAHKLLAESLLIGRQIGDRPNVSARLADLAGVWVTQGQPERAAKLFGAGEALREKVRATMYQGQRMAYERDVEMGSARLDPEAWRAAWAEGRVMSLDDAYELALEELPAREQDTAPPPATVPDTYDLTDRELEVLRLLAGGLTYGEIAQQLVVSFHTVHAHVRSIYGKLGVTSRNQAARFATEHGLA
jgi:non-specific serine/threonine protein kinase